MTYQGGCLCGKVRFASSLKPVDVGYCHCRMCQKISGAAALPWATFALATFDYVDGKPRVYRSSSHGQREFCNRCGSQIAFRSSGRAGTIEINVGTLDDPATVAPQFHIYYESRIPWFDTDDDLPRYARGEPAAD